MKARTTIIFLTVMLALQGGISQLYDKIWKAFCGNALIPEVWNNGNHLGPILFLGSNFILWIGAMVVAYHITTAPRP